MDRRTESEDADSAISGDDPKSGCEADRKMGGKRGKSALSDAGSVEQTGIWKISLKRVCTRLKRERPAVLSG